MDNLPADEESTKDSRNVVLQKDTENPMDVVNKRTESLKKMADKELKKDTNVNSKTSPMLIYQANENRC